MKRAFETRDANKDGFISIADFDLVVQRHRDIGTPEKHIKILEEKFKKLCESWGLTDRSMRFTIAEMLDKYCVQASERINVFWDLFESVDVNGNGEISFDEWVTHYKVMGIDSKHARPSFDAMDFNGDGTVSREEFVDYHKEFFQSNEDKLKSSILYGPLD